MSVRNKLDALKRILGAENFFLAEAFIEQNFKPPHKIKKNSNLYVAAVEYIGGLFKEGKPILSPKDLETLKKDRLKNQSGPVHEKLLKEFKKLEKQNKKEEGKPSAKGQTKQPLPDPTPGDKGKKEPPEVTLEADQKRVQKGGSATVTWTSKNAARISRTNIPGVTSRSPLSGSIEVKDIRRRRDLYIIVESLDGQKAEARTQIFVETQDYQRRREKGIVDEEPPTPTPRPRPPSTTLVSPSSRPQPEPRRRPAPDAESSNINNNILIGIEKSLTNISRVLVSQLKLGQRIFDTERKAAETANRLKKEEQMEAKDEGPSGTALMKAGAEKMISPFKAIIDKIVNFLFYTFLGRAFTEIIKWMNDPANKGKVDALGKFLKAAWPIILGLSVLFLTPLGSFILGTAQFLWGTIKTLKNLKSLIDRLIFKKGAKPPAPPGGAAAAAGGASKTFFGTPYSQTKAGKSYQAMRKFNQLPSWARKISSGSASRFAQSNEKIIQGTANIGDKLRVGSSRFGFKGMGGIAEAIASKKVGPTSGPIAKVAGKLGGSAVARAIPFLGTGIGAVIGTSRLFSGDTEGALLSYASGIPVAGWGALLLDLYRSFDPEGYKKNIRFGMSQEELNKVLSDAFGFAAGSMGGGGASLFFSGGKVFSGSVTEKDGTRVSGAKRDTQAFRVLDGRKSGPNVAVLEPGEFVVNRGGVKKAQEMGIDLLKLNTGPNANKPANITTGIKAMSTGGVVGGMNRMPKMTMKNSRPINKISSYRPMRQSTPMMNNYSSMRSSPTRQSTPMMNNYSSTTPRSMSSGISMTRPFTSQNRTYESTRPYIRKPEQTSYFGSYDKIARSTSTVYQTSNNFETVRSTPTLTAPAPISRRSKSETIILPPINQTSNMIGSSATGSGTQIPSFGATCPTSSAATTRKILCDTYGIIA